MTKDELKRAVEIDAEMKRINRDLRVIEQMKGKQPICKLYTNPSVSFSFTDYDFVNKMIEESEKRLTDRLEELEYELDYLCA